MQTFLCSAYLAPISFFTAIFRGGEVVFEQYDHYHKQTYRNRCVIETADGRQILTIPVEKADKDKQLMKDVRISEHGNWRHLHWNAIESAYMNSPYFIYYQDEFRPLYEKKFDFLLDFNMSLTEIILKLSGIQASVSLSSSYNKDINQALDYRNLIDPDQKIENDLLTGEYYQVFKKRHGFIDNLSMIDLLFNMGPESLLILRNRKI